MQAAFMVGSRILQPHLLPAPKNTVVAPCNGMHGTHNRGNAGSPGVPAEDLQRLRCVEFIACVRGLHWRGAL